MQALDPAALETLVTGSGWTALALVALFVAGLAWTGLVRVWQLLFVAGSLPVRGRHCLVTGGSRGRCGVCEWRRELNLRVMRFACQSVPVDCP